MLNFCNICRTFGTFAELLELLQNFWNIGSFEKFGKFRNLMNHGYLVINLYIGKRENHDKMDKIWEMEKKRRLRAFAYRRKKNSHLYNLPNSRVSIWPPWLSKCASPCLCQGLSTSVLNTLWHHLLIILIVIYIQIHSQYLYTCNYTKSENEKKMYTKAKMIYTLPFYKKYFCK